MQRFSLHQQSFLGRTFALYTTLANRQQIMPKLDNRGIIAAATIGFYLPPTILTLFLLIRYALRRDAGWLWLFIFSLCMWMNPCI